MTIIDSAPPPIPQSWREQIRVQWGPLLRMVLLIALGGMLVIKVLNGGIVYYVNSIYIRLILGAGIGMIVAGYAAGVRAILFRSALASNNHADHTDHTDHEHTHEHDHHHVTGRLEAVGYATLLLPLLLGLLVPARPLGASAVAARVNSSASGVSVNSRVKPFTGVSAGTDRWTLLDWYVATTQAADRRTLAGKPVSVVGFVSGSDTGLGSGYLTIARFVVICCIADGNAVTLPVRWDVAVPRDTWVQVTGAIAIADVSGKLTPYVAATSVQPIPQPDAPYLYP